MKGLAIKGKRRRREGKVISDGYNEKGFIMTLLLISLPLFISCLMVFVSLFFCIRNHDLTQSICLEHTLKAQTQMKRVLQDLLKLNPMADHLRNRQRQLEYFYRKALKTGQLISASTLRVKIQLIKRKRKFLDRKQKSILKSTSQYIELVFTSFQQKTRRFHSSDIRKYHHRPIPLAVRGKPKGELAPSYYPVHNFSLHQTFSISWKMPLYRFLPKWLERAFFQPKLSSYSCSATIRRKGSQWHSTLASLEYQNAKMTSIHI